MSETAKAVVGTALAFLLIYLVWTFLIPFMGGP